MTIANGTKLGHYEIRSKLGEGGMGEVHLALDEKLGRNVAFKTHVRDDLQLRALTRWPTVRDHRQHVVVRHYFD